MYRFFHKYLPYGCICGVLCMIVESINAIRFSTTIEGTVILSDIAMIMILTIACYVIDFYDFKSYRSYFFTRYVILFIIFMIAYQLFFTIPFSFHGVFNLWLIYTVNILLIQAYVNHTVVKETAQMNALLQKKKAEKN